MDTTRLFRPNPTSDQHQASSLLSHFPRPILNSLLSALQPSSQIIWEAPGQIVLVLVWSSDPHRNQHTRAGLFSGLRSTTLPAQLGWASRKYLFYRLLRQCLWQHGKETQFVRFWIGVEFSNFIHYFNSPSLSSLSPTRQSFYVSLVQFIWGFMRRSQH